MPQVHRIRAQADASLPFRKQAWATLVRHKITAQAEALKRVNEPSDRLRRLATAVRSGDPDNREAQAAQAYWPLMMDKTFRRDREASGNAPMRRATACGLSVSRRPWPVKRRYRPPAPLRPESVKDTTISGDVAEWSKALPC